MNWHEMLAIILEVKLSVIAFIIFSLLSHSVFAERMCGAEPILKKLENICGEISKYKLLEISANALEISDKSLVFDNCGLSQVLIIKAEFPFFTQVVPLRPWSNLYTNLKAIKDVDGRNPIIELAEISTSNKTENLKGIYNHYGTYVERAVFGRRCKLIDNSEVIAFSSLAQPINGIMSNTSILELDFSIWQAYLKANYYRFISTDSDKMVARNQLGDFYTKLISSQSLRISQMFGLKEGSLKKILLNRLKLTLQEADFKKDSVGFVFLRIHETLQDEIVGPVVAQQVEKERSGISASKVSLEIKDLKDQMNILAKRVPEKKIESSGDNLKISYWLSIVNSCIIAIIIFVLFWRRD